MANRKQDFIVKVLSDVSIHVWVDKSASALDTIEGIEGIDAIESEAIGPVVVHVDPRYDSQEIGEEIETLLSVEAPLMFREDKTEELLYPKPH